jgi:hypothetical protein
MLPAGGVGASRHSPVTIHAHTELAFRWEWGKMRRGATARSGDPQYGNRTGHP